MKLYLDMCCLKRPFDDQSDARIQMESLAVEAILEQCRMGQHRLVISDALRLENSRNPNEVRREAAETLLAMAVDDLPHSAELREQAKKWRDAGLELLDALHLASAELAEADCFASCDDVLLNRAKRVESKLRVLAVLDLFKELAS